MADFGKIGLLTLFFFRKMPVNAPRMPYNEQIFPKGIRDRADKNIAVRACKRK